MLHFWLVHGLLWLALTHWLSFDVARVGGEPHVFRSLFARGGRLIFGLSVVLWCLQMLADSPASPIIFSWPAPWRAVALCSVVLPFLIVFGWVQCGRGADLLAQAFGCTKRRARLVATLVLIAAIIVNALAFRASLWR